VNKGGTIQNVPHQVVAEIMSAQECRTLTYVISSALTDNMLCVRYMEAGQNFCSMLSGSSLVCRQDDKWWQHGFVSWGLSGCASATQPEVHSNVVKYLPWIKQKQNISGQSVSVYLLLAITGRKVTPCFRGEADALILMCTKIWICPRKIYNITPKLGNFSSIFGLGIKYKIARSMQLCRTLITNDHKLHISRGRESTGPQIYQPSNSKFLQLPHVYADELADAGGNSLYSFLYMGSRTKTSLLAF